MLKAIIGATRQVYTCLTVSTTRHFPRHIQTSSPCLTENKKKWLPEKADSYARLWRLFYPSAETMTMSIDGIPYNKLPIVHAKVTVNNSIVTLTRHTGRPIATTSGGCLGFHNSNSKTDLCAQTCGAFIGEKAMNVGIRNVRVSFKGIDKKRASILRGLKSTGVRIVSVTDATGIPFNGNRPKRRVRK